MPRHLIRRFTARLQPAVDRITSNPTVRRLAPAIADPDLWHLNRRSTARAVAIGLFCGLIPGPLQALAAIALCLAVRANFPLAVITTLYTNPLTIVPLYLVAYEIGRVFVTGADSALPDLPPLHQGLGEYLPALGGWMAGLGAPLALGLVLLASTLALLGWVAVRLGWRWHVVRAWQRRALARRPVG
jgi:uncharacterized protein (DUF2062 family)